MSNSPSGSVQRSGESHFFWLEVRITSSLRHFCLADSPPSSKKQNPIITVNCVGRMGVRDFWFQEQIKLLPSILIFPKVNYAYVIARSVIAVPWFLPGTSRQYIIGFRYEYKKHPILLWTGSKHIRCTHSLQVKKQSEIGLVNINPQIKTCHFVLCGLS